MNHSRTLLDIGDDLRALVDLWLDSCDPVTGEVPPEVDAMLVQLSQSIAVEEAEKLDRCVNLIRRKKAEIAAAKAEAERYMMHAKVRERFVDRFEEFLMQYVQRSGRTKVVTATGRTVAIQANGGKPPLRLIDPIDPATVPDHLVQVKRMLDMEAIRRGLEEADPDARRIAMLDARGCHLRIR